MKRIMRYLAPYKGRIAVGLMFKVAGTVAELVLPLIMSYMIDDVVPTRDLLALSLWGVGMLAAAVVALLGNVKANRMASKVARDTTERIRADLFRKTLSLSAQQVDEITLPSLVSRLSSDTYNVHNMIGMMQRLGVRAPILLVGGVALTFAVDAVLALVLLVSVPVLTVIVILVSRRGIGLYTRLQGSVDTMVRKVRDDYSGIRVIKALSKTNYESASFRAINARVVENETKAGVTMGITNPLMNAVLNLGMAAVVFVGAYRVAGGNAMVGDIIAFTSYFSIILNAVISVSRIFVNITKGSASARRIGAILDLPACLLPLPASETADSPDAEGVFSEAADGSGAERDARERTGAEASGAEAVIAFEDVTFAYSKAPALSGINFVLRRGESLGVIGATGSGKSTLIALLLRFYDPDAGRVLIDGKDIRSYENGALRKKFGVVFQSDFLMAASVRENIDFARGLREEAIERAAEYARADGFIRAHEGYDGMLTARGANYSGGQKQRLLIARALAGEPEILILDDSSSAFDYRTDAALRKTLITQLSGTTLVMIAQRISSVRFADKILVLDGGRAVGYGTDEELMRTCETYRRIYESQHEGEGSDACDQ